MSGLDSLLSIVQMPKGVPVATVAIGGAENAAILAVQMLALKYPGVEPKISGLQDNPGECRTRGACARVRASI